MVEKTTEVPADGVSTRAGALAAGLPVVRTDIPGEDDSDDDQSEPDEDVTLQGTDDTQVVSNLNVQGMAMYDGTRCLLELAQRVKGYAILCGHLRVSCPRRKHRELQKIEGRRGHEGYYQQLPNSKGTINDAVADTDSYLLPQAWVDLRQSNRVMLTRLG
jgi:hypothetical protein